MRSTWQNSAPKEAFVLLEHIEIYRLIQRRKRKASNKRITLDALLKEQHIPI